VTSLRTPGRQTGATPDPMGEREPAVLHLLIPGLLDRAREWQSDYGGVGRYPSLEWLLAVRVRSCRVHGEWMQRWPVFSNSRARCPARPSGAWP
jgi:hypothetical protein